MSLRGPQPYTPTPQSPQASPLSAATDSIAAITSPRSGLTSKPQDHLLERWYELSKRLRHERLTRSALIAINRTLDTAEDALGVSTTTTITSRGPPTFPSLQPGSSKSGGDARKASLRSKEPPRRRNDATHNTGNEPVSSPSPATIDPTSADHFSQDATSRRSKDNADDSGSNSPPQSTPCQPRQSPTLDPSSLEKLTHLTISLRKRHEESKHIHHLLLTKAHSASQTILYLQERVIALEADAQADRAELKYLKMKMDGVMRQRSRREQQQREPTAMMTPRQLKHGPGYGEWHANADGFKSRDMYTGLLGDTEALESWVGIEENDMLDEGEDERTVLEKRVFEEKMRRWCAEWDDVDRRFEVRRRKALERDRAFPETASKPRQDDNVHETGYDADGMTGGEEKEV